MSNVEKWPYPAVFDLYNVMLNLKFRFVMFVVITRKKNN